MFDFGLPWCWSAIMHDVEMTIESGTSVDGGKDVDAGSCKKKNKVWRLDDHQRRPPTSTETLDE